MRFFDTVFKLSSNCVKSGRKAILGRYLIVSRVVHWYMKQVSWQCKEKFKIERISEKRQIVCKMASLDGGRFCGYF